MKQLLVHRRLKTTYKNMKFTIFSLLVSFLIFKSKADPCTNGTEPVKYAACEAGWLACTQQLQDCNQITDPTINQQECYDDASNAYDKSIAFVTTCECAHPQGSCKPSSQPSSTNKLMFPTVSILAVLIYKQVFV